MEIKGIDEVKAKLSSLPGNLQRKGFRFALRKAANIVVQDAKQRAQAVDDSETGRSIAANIVAKFSPKYLKSTGDLMFRVGVVGGARIPKDGGSPDAGQPTPHWRLVEFGTSKMAARPFLRPALEQNVGRCIDTFAIEANKAIDRALKKRGS